MMVTEVGSEVDVGMMQTKETNKGGTFKDKFKHSGKTPTQVWTDKYRPLLKSNGWGINYPGIRAYPWEELPDTTSCQKIGCGGGGVGDGSDGGYTWDT